MIRHAYVKPSKQNKGIGGHLLSALKDQAELPLLVGTWKAAKWAIKFYEKHGFALVGEMEREELLRKYWNIPKRQIEASVVVADDKRFQIRKGRINETDL